MPRNVARHLEVLDIDLDQVAQDVAMIVDSVRSAGKSSQHLDSLEADVLLRVARARRTVNGLRADADQAS